MNTTTPTDLVVGFDRPELALLPLVGGKGSNLIQLAAAGFPVPPGFVVTAEAYRLFAAEAGWVDAALAALAYDDPARLRDCARPQPSRTSRRPHSRASTTRS
jgi:pyruvate,water dikinase